MEQLAYTIYSIVRNDILAAHEVWGPETKFLVSDLKVEKLVTSVDIEAWPRSIWTTCTMALGCVRASGNGGCRCSGKPLSALVAGVLPLASWSSKESLSILGKAAQ